VTQRIAVLAGGVGAARFLRGLVMVVPPEQIAVIVNTGDDIALHGLHVSPDLDTVMYALAGVAHPEQGWGIAGDTFHALAALGRLGAPDTWFRLGDQDLATHLRRTVLLAQGHTLTSATTALAAALGIRTRILPMTDLPVTTRVLTPNGELHLQEYFVREACRPPVLGVRFEGREAAYPTSEALEAIANATAVIVAPSNPIISIGPILALSGMREALRAAPPVVAITPLIGGRAVKGPTVELMRGTGLEPHAAAVAQLYADFLTAFVLDVVDADSAEQVRATGALVATTDTRLDTPEAAARVARVALESAGIPVA
jgi:LPPG:FO 2-phospho-L-lactate transferase